MRKTIATCVLLASILSTQALAADWYVDPINGSDGNGGTSPTDAWRTLRHSLVQIPLGAHTLRLSPGTYDQTIGESFPLALRDGIDLVGESSRDDTFVVGNGQTDIFMGSSEIDTPASYVLRNFTVRAATCGVSVRAPEWDAGALSLELADMRFEACGDGVYFGIFNLFQFPNLLTVDRVDFIDCTNSGIRAISEDFNDPVITVRDSTFRGLACGAYCEAGIECYMDADFFRCTFVENTTAIELAHQSSGQVLFEINDSLIADNVNGILGESRCRIRRSTIAHNSNVGLHFNDPPSGSSLNGSVIFGNGDDVDIPMGSGSFGVTDNNIGDGDYAGSFGNISVDPLFVNPDRGDYRLGFGADCVDALNTTAGVDLTGSPRGVDGDLDFDDANDMGALELRTLDMPDTVGIGKKLNIEFYTEPGNFSVLWLARGQQLAVPDATPFGDRWLPLPLLELVATRKALTSAPILVTVHVPDDPALVGQPLSFQALSRSSTSPAGGTWTLAKTVILTE
ncbi:MAG: DUF1565 domain-containing protein [bacterium]|nr:DUF1565 domain-containing protein [bacterium]